MHGARSSCPDVIIINIMKKENQQLNPIRRKINTVIVPLYLAVFAVALTVGGILMSKDEECYLVVFLILIGIVLLMTVALLASLPLIRKKEVAIEVEKYNLELLDDDIKASYCFSANLLNTVLRCETTPFDDGETTTTRVIGLENLKSALDGLTKEATCYEETDGDNCDIYVADLSKDERYTAYEINRLPDATINIYVSPCIEFQKEYVSVNGYHFLYDDITATFNATRTQNRIVLNIVFEFNEELFASIKLNKFLVATLKQFPINLINREVLDFVLTDKSKAFEQILKYGKIKKH